MSTPRVDKNSTLPGTAPLTAIRQRKLTRPQLVALPKNGHNKSSTRLYIRGGQTWSKDWINGGPTELGGAGLDKDIVNINVNYMNYIQSNTKLVQTVDDLSVEDTGTT